MRLGLLAHLPAVGRRRGRRRHAGGHRLGRESNPARVRAARARAEHTAGGGRPGAGGRTVLVTPAKPTDFCTFGAGWSEPLATGPLPDPGSSGRFVSAIAATQRVAFLCSHATSAAHHRRGGTDGCLDPGGLLRVSILLPAVYLVGIGRDYPIEMTSQEANCPDVQQWPTDTKDMPAWLR